MSEAPAPAPASNWRDHPEWPDVDVVMPILNEANHLESAVTSVRAQAYPGLVRIILAIGPSNDGTDDVANRLAESSDDILVVENASGRTPSALNRAIDAGSAPVVVRVDGHSQLSAGYIRRAVEILRTTMASNVGGIQRPEPTTEFEQVVADATTSVLGTGGASYRLGTEAGPVDTVYLGVFDRQALEEVGRFDESLLRNQDYELNIRLREAGGTVWFDPSLSVGYTPRSTWRRLAGQYYEYGWWKSVVMRKHPRSVRVRQIVPPLAVLGITAGLLVGVKWRPALLAPAAYGIAVASSVRQADQPIPTAAALGVIHTTWAIGLLRGFLSSGA